MLITGLYDKLMVKFVQFIPTTSISVLKRDFKNAVKDPNSIYHANSEDFVVYTLCSIDDATGECTSQKELAFNLSELIDDPQVQ